MNLRKTTEMICPICGKSYQKANSEIKRNLQKNRLNFCSISCAAKYNNTIHPKKGNPKNLKHGSTKDEFSKFRETLRKAKMHAKQKKK